MTQDMDSVNLNDNWALIASDPAVFADMIRKYGVYDTTVQEVYTLEFEQLGDPTDVHGLIFISRYFEEELPVGFEKADPDADQIVFTAQVVTNVCATLALLSIILNADIEKGRMLSDFLEFTAGFTPINRGLCLGNSTAIRRIHDSYASVHHLADQLRTDDGEEIGDDVEYVTVQEYHYISYIYKNGYVWELDGLKSQPVKLASCCESTWLEALKPILMERMNASIENEIDFSMMAVKREPFQSLIQQREIYKLCLDEIRNYMRDCYYITIHNIANNVYPANAGAGYAHYLTFDITKENAYWLRRTAFEERLKECKPSPLLNDMYKLWNSLIEFDERIYERTAQPLIKNLKQETKRLGNTLRALAAEKRTQKKDVDRLSCDYFLLIQGIIKAGLKEGLLSKRGTLTKKKKKQFADAASSSGSARGGGRPRGKSRGGTGKVTKKR